jgi:hypothetical protein
VSIALWVLPWEIFPWELASWGYSLSEVTPDNEELARTSGFWWRKGIDTMKGSLVKGCILSAVYSLFPLESDGAHWREIFLFFIFETNEGDDPTTLKLKGKNETCIVVSFGLNISLLLLTQCYGAMPTSMPPWIYLFVFIKSESCAESFSGFQASISGSQALLNNFYSTLKWFSTKGKNTCVIP